MISQTFVPHLPALLMSSKMETQNSRAHGHLFTTFRHWIFWLKMQTQKGRACGHVFMTFRHQLRNWGVSILKKYSIPIDRYCGASLYEVPFKSRILCVRSPSKVKFFGSFGFSAERPFVHPWNPSKGWQTKPTSLSRPAIQHRDMSKPFNHNTGYTWKCTFYVRTGWIKIVLENSEVRLPSLHIYGTLVAIILWTEHHAHVLTSITVIQYLSWLESVTEMLMMLMTLVMIMTMMMMFCITWICACSTSSLHQQIHTKQMQPALLIRSSTESSVPQVH